MNKCKLGIHKYIFMATQQVEGFEDMPLRNVYKCERCNKIKYEGLLLWSKTHLDNTLNWTPIINNDYKILGITKRENIIENYECMLSTLSVNEYINKIVKDTKAKVIYIAMFEEQMRNLHELLLENYKQYIFKPTFFNVLFLKKYKIKKYEKQVIKPIIFKLRKKYIIDVIAYKY